MTGATSRPEPESGATGSPEPVARCRSVTREYTRGSPRSWSLPFVGGSRRPAPPVVAVSDVSIDVHRGELVGLRGPSGSGKSTLLHLLAGLDAPTAGTVEVAGMSLRGLSERRRARLRLEHVGIVFQHFYLLPSLSARSNVALPLIQRGVGRRDRRARATALLEDVGLADRIDHHPGELSGGEQQRVAIARALANDPDLLLADEPTGEVDSETGERLIELFSEFASDRAVVVASHDDRVLDAADRVLGLRDSRLVTDG